VNTGLVELLVTQALQVPVVREDPLDLVETKDRVERRDTVVDLDHQDPLDLAANGDLQGIHVRREDMAAAVMPMEVGTI